MIDYCYEIICHDHCSIWYIAHQDNAIEQQQSSAIELYRNQALFAGFSPKDQIFISYHAGWHQARLCYLEH